MVPGDSGRVGGKGCQAVMVVEGIGGRGNGGGYHAISVLMG